MRLLFLIDHLYLHGGAEKVLTERCNYMADAMGFDITILTTEQQGKPSCYPLSAKVKRVDIGVNYHRDSSYFHPKNIAKIPFHFRGLNKQIRRINPDVVISLNYAFDFYWLPFIFKRIPKWKEFHGSRYFDFQNRKNQSFAAAIKYKINAWIEARFDKLLLLNPGEAAFFESGNTIVIPNPVALPETVAALDREIVISAGRMTYIKGFEYLIAAWQLVHEQFPAWQLHIYGDGDPGYKEKIVLLAQQSGLDGVVRILDATDQLQEAMRNASIYAMASQTECFPMVLLESLSVGLPVVSFDCPTGPRHIVTEGYDGFLVEPNNSGALANRLMQLMQGRALRNELGKNARESARKFATAAVMQQWEAHLKEQLKS